MLFHRKGEKGGIDLVQLVVALIIVCIAAATATFSMYIGRGALQTEYRKKRALQLARDNMEYWTVKAYWGENGEPLNPYICALPDVKVVVLDERDIDTRSDDIECEIIREPIKKNYHIFGEDTLLMYKIKINVVWNEPVFPNEPVPPPDTVSLQSWMIHYYSVAN